MNSNIRDKLKELPTSSGVYLMYNALNEIIYVGKAVNLRNRVHQYFQSSGNKSEKTIQLVKNIVDFRYIITANEIDALVLENNLIKKYAPKYNILLKDDKSYPFIKINLKSNYPTVEVVRKLVNDGSKYFGPYMQGINTKQILELIFSAFSLRSCKKDLTKLPSSHRPCLNSHIGRCKAPCIGAISEEEYAIIVKQVMDFLKGNDDAIQKLLEQKMLEASKREDFELAMYYRDKLKVLEKLIRQQISALPKKYNMDIFAAADNGVYSAVSVLIVRGGKLLGGDNYPLTNSVNNGKTSINTDKNPQSDVKQDLVAETLMDNMMSQFIMQYYEQNPNLPDEIAINIKSESSKSLEAFLQSSYGKKTNIIVPIQGVRKQLVSMAENNAMDYLNTFVVKKLKRYSMTEGAVESLKEKLSLKNLPNRIECYDISHISGTDKVASMTVFIDGEAAKKMYRRFKIKTVEGNNDFACMKEVLLRRFQRLESSDESFGTLPDLIVIDGGKGQLKYALEAMEESGVSTQMISLAKREEEIILPHVEESVILPRRSMALALVCRIRDEAHRFAIEYHRKLRSKHMALSELKSIKGIGDKKIRALYEHFSSITKIGNAEKSELVQVKGISSADADKLIEYFKQTKK